MTRDDITRMAREAGPLISTPFDVWCERFAALVAAAERERSTFELAESYRCGWDGGVQAEREACAKTAEAHIEEWTDDRPKYALYECAAAIRERDKK